VFPHGSILETLLFIIIINDLILNINTNSKLVLFADDTIALITANSLNDLLTKPVITLIQRDR